jgi:predicted glycoside hydrolase/deacetylase ChbG (UPF0249 family)
MDVIVNADDLGMSLEVNHETFNLMDEGAVTSATLLANAPFVEDACRRIPNYEHCSFGFHLDVTEFRPVHHPSKLLPLLNEDGEFDVDRVRQVGIDSTLADGIFQEYCAQIEKLADLGVMPSHIDSHHHVHTIPRVFFIIKKVQKKFRIRKVRLTRNIYADWSIDGSGISPATLGLAPGATSDNVPRQVRLKKSVYNLLLKHYYRTKTTDGFSGFRLFLEYAKLRKMNHRTFEVMVHPSNEYYDPEEIELLRGAWQEDLDFPVRLISYHDLD